MRAALIGAVGGGGGEQAPTSDLPEIVVRDTQFFGLADGRRWTAIEASDFNFAGALFDGRDMTPVLDQRQECGFNLLRIWTRFDIPFIGRLMVEDHPDLYDRMPDVVRLCAGRGLHIEFTAYTGINDPDHWDRLTDALKNVRPKPLLELVNEHDICWNMADAQGRLLQAYDPRYRPVPGFICSHGSDAIRPWWQYETVHWNAASEWWRKCGHNAMEYSVGAEDLPPSHVPVLSNENPRYGDNETNIQHGHDAAAGAALLCAGSCFHSVRGKTSQLWEGAELDAAREWARGAREVDLECQQGSYVHRGDLEGPPDLRVYDRPTPGHSCVVRIGV